MYGHRIKLSCVLLVLCAGAFVQGAEATKPCLGVQLDPNPLPQLLTRHLKLDPGEGILITNIVTGSPADRIGLDKDDIILKLNGQATESVESFVARINQTPSDQNMTLTVMQSGAIRQIECQLGATPATIEWKYRQPAAEPEIWRPGRIFQIKPGDSRFEMIDPETLPDTLREWRKEFKLTLPEMSTPFNKMIVYHYQHQGDGQDISVTIQGDPDSTDCSITVTIGQEHYSATPGNLDAIPESHRQTVQDDLKKARESKVHIKIPRITEQITLPDIKKLTPLPEGAREELEALKKRMDALEKKLDEKVKQLNERLLPPSKSQI